MIQRYTRKLFQLYSQTKPITLLQYPINIKQHASLPNELPYNELIHNYRSILHKATQPKDLQKLKQKHKLPVRQRIQKLLDAGSPFLQLSPLAGYELYDQGEDIYSGGIVTGIGLIHNKFCMIIANDPTVKGGSYYPITVKKQLRAQQIAQQNRLPCFYLVDSGGANLPRQSQVFPDSNHFGRIFYNMANMSAENIPQIAIVLGSCTAGGAYVPVMADENIITQGNGTIFLGGPPLVKAVTNEIVTSQQLGGGKMHTTISGVSDYLAKNQQQALIMGRNIAQRLNTPQVKKCPSFTQPLYQIEQLEHFLSTNIKKEIDSKIILSRILDGSLFHQYKENYGKTLITGYGSIYGNQVGIIANNGPLLSDSAQKGANFIEICSQRMIPLIFLQNITGFMVGKKHEQEGIAKHGSKLVNAIATTGVPKITCIIGASYGAGNYGMCGRAFGPRLLFMWPSAKIAVMGGDKAAEVLTQITVEKLKKRGKSMPEEENQRMKTTITNNYQKQSSCYYSTARLWDDGIILPSQTRKVLGLSLMIASNTINPTKHGLFRM